jgi:hypothetical protein
MPKTVHGPSRTTPEAPVYPADLDDEMQDALASWRTLNLLISSTKKCSTDGQARRLKKRVSVQNWKGCIRETDSL